MSERNDHLTAVFTYREAFTAAECRTIAALADTMPEADVGVYPEPATPARKAGTRILPSGPASAWIEDRLSSLADDANAFYRFTVERDIRPLFVCSYQVGGYFHWHTDLADGDESTRKISFSVQLSAPDEYDGGSLEMISHGQPLPAMPQGSVVLFPAHLAHRVHPVTRGVRCSLVAWMHGPAFR